MKVFETKTITRTVEEKTLVERKCDLCSRKARSEQWTSFSTYNIDETEVSVTIRQKEGVSYPEGGSGTEYEIDLCPACFRDRLIPWLQSQGAVIEQKDWDW